MRTKVVHATGLPGLQRVVSICNLDLGDELNPKIQVLFRKLKDLRLSSESKLDYTGEETAVTVPLGDILSLRVGAVLENDQLIASPDTRDYKILVDFRHGMAGCKQRKDLDQFVLSKQLPNSEIRSLIKPEDSWWYVAPSLDKRFRSIVFISTSIFTTWYAQSSRMATRIVLGEFRDMTRTLVDRSRTKGLDRDRNGYITLKRGVLVADIITIARAWYDEPLFRSRINGIRSHLSLQATAKGTINLRCAPPIESVVELSVQGIVLPAGGNDLPSLLVLEVDASNEPMPFDTLEARVDQVLKSGEKRGGKGDDNSSDEIERGKAPEEFAKEFVRLDGNDSTPGSAPPVIAQMRINATRFIKLKEQPTVIRRLSKPNGKKRRLFNGNTSKNSTGRGNNSGDPDNRQTELTTPNQNGGDGADGQDGDITPNIAITSVLNAFNHLVANGIVIESKCITETKCSFRGYVLNEVPDRTDSRGKKWTHILKGAVRRPILIAELTNGDNYAYVVEIVRNLDDQFSTLIFCRPDKSRVDDQALKDVFKAINNAKKLPSEATIRTILGDTLSAQDQSNATPSIVIRIRHVTVDGSVLAYRLNDLLA